MLPNLRTILIIISSIFFIFQPSSIYAETIHTLPSSAKILFVSSRDTTDRRTDIYAMDVDGKNVKRITDSSYHHFIIGIDSSKRYIAASRASEDTAKPSGLGDEDKRALWVIDLKEKNSRRLTDPNNHAEGDSFSPDGQWIVFLMKIGDSTQSDIYKIKNDGTQLTQLTNTPEAVEGDPDWSHDGSKIVFAYLDNETKRFVLKTMNPDGSNIQLLHDGGPGVSTPAFPPGDYDPTWSPDGEWITYERCMRFKGANWGNGKWNIFKVRADGSEVTNLSQAGGHTGWAEFLPSFSPDGHFITFAAYYAAPNPLKSMDDVLLMDKNGRNVMRITDHPKSDKYPVWIE